MRVTKDGGRATSQADTAQPRSRFNQILQLGLLVLVFILGFVIGQQGWHRPFTAFLASFIQRPAFTVAALAHRSDLPTLHVDLRFRDYQRLLDKRDQALSLGVNVAADQDYVPASIRQAEINATVQMRLPEGLAKNLSNEAWPFEVIVGDSETLLGLRRFTLVPADTTVLSTWGYLETLRRAGLLSPRYHLVHLVLNGSSWGLYTLEEQITPESLTAQGWPDSAIAYFDRSVYWAAYARLGDALPGTGFQYAHIAIDCAATTADQGVAGSSAPSDTCASASRLMRGLQANTHVPSDLLDVESTGTFLALTTLWRGRSELDWRTTRLAYDPTDGRFQPIGAGDTMPSIALLPQNLTDDPAVQIAYVRALVQFSHADYLAQLQAGLTDELEVLQLAIGGEMGYLEMPWSALEVNQAAMRRLIAPPDPLSVYVEADSTALVLRLSNVQPFPVQVVGLDIGENALVPIDPTWIHGSDHASLVEIADIADTNVQAQTGIILRAAAASTPRTIYLRIPPQALPTGYDWIIQSPDQLHVIARLAGLSEQNIAVTALFDELTSWSDADRETP